MARAYSKPFILAGIYDFANDGGAEGDYLLNDYTPWPKAFVMGFFYKILTSFTGNALTVVEFGLYQDAGNRQTSGYTVGSGNLVAGSWLAAPGIDYNAVPYETPGVMQLSIRIADFPATAGKVILIAKGFSVDF